MGDRIKILMPRRGRQCQAHVNDRPDRPGTLNSDASRNDSFRRDIELTYFSGTADLSRKCTYSISITANVQKYVHIQPTSTKQCPFSAFSSSPRFNFRDLRAGYMIPIAGYHTAFRQACDSHRPSSGSTAYTPASFPVSPFKSLAPVRISMRWC